MDRYIIARHITGIGVGCTSLSSYILGTEYCPRSKATFVKTGWSLFSIVGYINMAFIAKLLFDHLPGYN